MTGLMIGIRAFSTLGKIISFQLVIVWFHEDKKMRVDLRRTQEVLTHYQMDISTEELAHGKRSPVGAQSEPQRPVRPTGTRRPRYSGSSEWLR
jgi:hypothetical protein